MSDDEKGECGGSCVAALVEALARVSAVWSDKGKGTECVKEDEGGGKGGKGRGNGMDTTHERHTEEATKKKGGAQYVELGGVLETRSE